MAESSTAAPEGVIARRRARRRRHRRNLLLGGLVVVLVAGGAGTAWAMRGSGGTEYRLATATRGAVRQTVGADGTLAAHRTASAAFAAAGTVSAVAVSVGDKVAAGQTLANLDPTSLDMAVTTAKTTVAQAEQQLADDEQAQADGTSSTSVSSTSNSTATTPGQQQTSTGTSATNRSATNRTATTAGFADDAVLTSQVTTGRPTGGSSGSSTGTSSGGSGSLSHAQDGVVKAQQKLDDAVSAQDENVQKLVKSCADTGSDSTPTTVPATPNDSNTITGSGGSAAVVVTLLDANGDVATSNDANPQRLGENGTYSFSGLETGKSYTVQLSRTSVISSADCTTAVTAVQREEQTLDSTKTALRNALVTLTKALGSVQTSSNSGSTDQGSASGGSSKAAGGTSSTRQPSSQSTGGSGQGGTSTQTGTPVTAEQIAADSQAVDAAKADLAVARSDRSHAVLTAPISGTIAAVDLTKGDSVSAGSSSQVITVVGDGSLTVDLDISLADIDLVKAGQSAQVTVDGHTGTLPAKVTYVGQTNSSDSTGSSATYTVTVQLTKTYPSLYDGMGADVAIDVGTVANTLTVPVSAVHTIGSRHTVLVDAANGTVTTTLVTLGLVGDSVAQVKSGLKAGQRVVLADVSAAVPSADTNSSRRGNFGGGSFGGGSFGGGTGGPPGGGAGGGPGG